MRKGFWIKLASSLVVFVLLLAPVSAAGAQSNSASADEVGSSPPTAPSAPLDIPETLVGSGTVSDFVRVNTVLYWHTAGYCYNPPHGPTAPANAGDIAEAITRTSTIYVSPDRGLYYKDIRATNGCNQYVFSRIVADDNYLYWVDATGLVKLSKNANVSDTPQVLSNFFSDQKAYQIAIDSQYIYLSRDGYSSGCPNFCFYHPPRLDKIDKTTGTVTGLDCTVLLGCPYAVNMKVDPGERYLYYIDFSGNLQRMDLSNPTSIRQLATDVHSYFPDGSRFLGCTINPFKCFYSDYVFIGRGATAAGQTHEIIRYDNSSETAVNIYTSSWSQDVSINDIVSDGTEIFFYEVRADVVCGGCFQTYTAWLYRSGRSNANSLANIYQYAAGLVAISASYGLDTDGVKVYWTDSGDIKRLSNQASALPKSPMHVTGLEVTQGVQTVSNSVPLIKGKRTFVRVYVKSDDSTRDVPGVTARLRAAWTGGSGDWIYPTNVYAVTVKRNPSRQNLNDAFLFELPWDWLQGDNLQITAELNPGHNPEQSDNYVNNVMTVGPFHLNPPPRLEVRLFEYYYAMGGTVFGPAYAEKFGNIDWIRRAYPVDESNGNMQTPGGGLRWSWTTIRDDALANLVRYPSVPCEDKDTTSNPNPALPDCQNLRASAYVASQIAGMRNDLKAYGDTDNTTYYGLIAQGSEQRGNPPMTVTYFPRGQDGGKNGAGPAGNSFLGWYAGHEVGHSVGLGHPATAAAANECGIKGSDSYPTNPHGDIGSNDDTTNVEGFLDTPSYNYPRYDNSNLAIGSQTRDVMAYCGPFWFSDQNYTHIYKNLTGNTPYQAMVASPQQNGDWLVVYGSIISGTNTAYMDYLRHTLGNVTVPPLTPGNYAIRLRDGSGNVLHDYAFTPAADADTPVLSFGQVVTFTAGTRDVRIVRLSDQQVLADAPISANPPSVSNVHLVSAPNPVTGTITLAWSASDPDGDPLKFDVLYSRDNGVSFQPLILHTATLTQQMDTSALGGGTGKFRVVASDGFNTGQADSASFTMANKPPVPIITLPTNGIHAHYGQVINFSGYAVDAQDGMVSNAGLAWSSAAGALGAGPLMTQSLLPPGADVITLTATNSEGLAASASVTVYVDDNIDPDGPTLQVSPGSVTWAINSGVTTPQTQTLTVSNLGTGSFTWQASSDSTWLTVSATSGNDGNSLVATGNPAGMNNGETRSGHLTFTTTNNGYTQTLQLPVSLTQGDIFQSAYTGPMPPLRFVYLPIVIK
jgi:hypothetical protein